jgi:putative transposase
MVTAGTYRKEHFLHDADRLRLVHDALLDLAVEFGWQLQAWAVLANHYHFVAVSPGDPETLRPFLSKLHTTTATALNRMDSTAGRKVWYQFWDTALTYQRSYLSRLRYVHENAVHHQVVDDAVSYPWCSAAWFERTASRTFRATVGSFRIDRLSVRDDF